jgi:DNA primase
MDTSKINLLTLIGNDTRLKKRAGTNGGEWQGACPFCGGRDRFSVQPNARQGGRWSCRVCTPNWNDAISYVQKRDGVGYKEACEQLGLELESAAGTPGTRRARRTARVLRTEPPPAPPLVGDERDYPALADDGWQAAARAFMVDCMNTLDTSAGDKARQYLLDRGLSETVIIRASIGYNPTDINTRWGAVDVYLPAGIVIPWEIGGVVWKINIRCDKRGKDDPKYRWPAGCANGLYNADMLRAGCTVVMVEGEIDALSILSAGVTDVIPVATGTTSGARLLRWVAKLATAKRVLLAFDNDANGAGDKAAAYWGDLLGSKAQRLKPTRHDMNDMLTSGEDIGAWLAGKPMVKPMHVSEVLTQPAPAPESSPALEFNNLLKLAHARLPMVDPQFPYLHLLSEPLYFWKG